MRPPLQLIEDAFRLITSNLFIYVTYAVVMTVLSVVPLFIYGINPMTDMFGNEHSLGSEYFIFTLILTLVFAGVFIALLKSFSDGAAASFESSIAFVKEHYVKFVIVCILYYISIVVGMILLIIPGLLATFFFAFAPLVVLFEGIDGVGALKRSYAYVKANALSVLWRVIVIGLLSMVISMVLSFSYVVAMFGGGIGVVVISTFMSVVVNVLFFAYVYCMYVDMKAIGIPVPATVETTTGEQQQN